MHAFAALQHSATRSVQKHPVTHDVYNNYWKTSRMDFLVPHERALVGHQTNSKLRVAFVVFVDISFVPERQDQLICDFAP